nr:MAG TPA: minor tail protein [Caudoviricetes sp.]
MAYDGSIKIDTKLDTSGLQTGLSKLGGIAKSGLKATVTAIGAVGTGLLAAGGFATKAGIEFESAFAGIRKTVDATEEQFEQLEAGILSMSKRIPQSAAELSSIGEAAGQLGIKTENIEGFIETMANLGVATNMTSEEAATSLARLANITQMPQTEFNKLGSVIVALGNNLATTESEITAMGLRIAGAANQVGMSEAEIMAFSGALSSVGIEAEAGGTAFSTLISKMNLATAQGGKDLQNFASVAGMSADEFKQSFEQDASGAILSFVKGLANVNESGGSAIAVLDEIGLSDIRMRDAMLRAAGASDVFSEALNIGTQAWDENTALTKEAEQRYKTMESRIQLLKNGVTNLGIAFYQSTNENIGGAVDLASDYINQLEDAFKNNGIEGLVEKLGDVFADLTTHIAKSAPKMIDAAVKMINSFVKGIQKNAGKIAEGAAKIVKALVDGIVKLIPTIISTAKKIVSEFAKELGKAVPLLKPFTGAIQLITDNLNILAPAILSAVGAMKAWSIVQTVTKMVTGLSTTFKALAGDVNWYVASLNIAKITEIAHLEAMTLKEVLVGTLTGKIKLATAAQYLWNAAMNANPIGIVVTAVAAFAAVLGALYIATRQQSSIDSEFAMKLDNLKIKTDELCEKTKEFNDSVKEGQKQHKDNVENIGLEADTSKRLADELFNLNSKQEKTVSDKTKMKEIVKELNERIPELKLNYNEETGALEANREETYKVIEAKRQLARQEAMTDLYTESVKNRTQAEFSMNQLLGQRKEIQKSINNLTYDKLGQRKKLSTEEADRLRELNGELSNVEIQISDTSKSWSTSISDIDYVNKQLGISSSETSSSVRVSVDSIKDSIGSIPDSTESMKTALSNFGNSMVTDSSKYGADFIIAWQNALNTASPEALASVEAFYSYVVSTMDNPGEFGEAANKGLDEYVNAWYTGTKDSNFGINDKTKEECERATETSSDGGYEAGKKHSESATQGASENPPDFTEPINTGADNAEPTASTRGNGIGGMLVAAIKMPFGIDTSISTALSGLVTNASTDAETTADTGGNSVGVRLVQGLCAGINSMWTWASQQISGFVNWVKSLFTGKQGFDEHSPSKWAKGVGSYLLEGLQIGMEKQKKNTIKSLTGLLTQTKEAGKKVMGIRSPSTVMRDEIGAQIDRGIAEGIRENSDTVLDKFNTLLDALKDKRELNIISEEEYHTQLEALTREHLDENSKEWRQHMMEVYQYQQETYEKSIKAAEDAYTKIADTAKSKLDKILKAQESFKEKMTSGSLIGTIYSEADGSRTQIGTYLNDPNYDARAMTAYAEQIKKIQGLAGDNAGFISQILREMDLATGQQFLNTLLNMDPAKLDAFLKGLTENAVAKINSMENSEKLNFADMLFYMSGTDKKSAAQMIVEQMAGIASEADAAQTLADLLWGPDNAQLQAETENSFYEEYGQSLPADFWQFGEDAAANFAKSFVDRTSSQESQAEIKAAGETAGSAFAAGVSESLSKETMKAELEKTFGTVPDSFFDLGEDSADSFGEGFTSRLKAIFANIQNAVASTMASMSPVLVGGGTVGNISTYNASYNFYGSGQTVSQQLQASRQHSEITRMRGN